MTFVMAIHPLVHSLIQKRLSQKCLRQILLASNHQNLHCQNKTMFINIYLNYINHAALGVLMFFISFSAFSGGGYDKDNCEALSQRIMQLDDAHIDQLKPEGKNYAAGLYRLYGMCILKGVKKGDVAKAMPYLKKAKEMGDKNGAHILASIQLFQSDDVKEQKAGFEYLTKEYKSGSMYAAGKLGWAYHQGIASKKNDMKALMLYQEAAEGGLTLWQYLLAYIFENGLYGQEPNHDGYDYWVNYNIKLQAISYSCAISSLYSQGNVLPNNPSEEEKHRVQCQKEQTEESMESGSIKKED